MAFQRIRVALGHRRVVGELAGLDQRLKAQVDQSAQVVTNGRVNLEAVRKWVLDPAASVPHNAPGERTLLTIVKKGIGEVIDIVRTSNGELNSIGAKIRGMEKVTDKDGKSFFLMPSRYFGRGCTQGRTDDLRPQLRHRLRQEPED